MSQFIVALTVVELDSNQFLFRDYICKHFHLISFQTELAITRIKKIINANVIC